MHKSTIKSKLAELSKLTEGIEWPSSSMTSTEIAKVVREQRPRAVALFKKLSFTELKGKGFICAIMAFGPLMQK